MNKVLISLALEAFIRGALETAATLRKMDAEGRTTATPEEEKALQDATDAAQQIALSRGEELGNDPAG